MLFANAAGSRARARTCDSHESRRHHAAIGGKAWDL